MLDTFFRYEYSAIFTKNPVFKRPSERKRIPQLPTSSINNTQGNKVVMVFPNNKVIH